MTQGLTSWHLDFELIAFFRQQDNNKKGTFIQLSSSDGLDTYIL